jgi:hypothetical protein
MVRRGVVAVSGAPSAVQISAHPGSVISRPNNAPAYYLGRPAAVWIAGLSRIQPTFETADPPPDVGFINRVLGDHD